MARSKKDRTTFPLSLRTNEDPRIREFLELQSGGYSDVLRYLIEKEIAENGIRDLTALIPARRSIDNFYQVGGTSNVPSNHTIKPQIEDNSEVEHTSTESKETKEEKEIEYEREYSTSSKEVEVTVQSSKDIEESSIKTQSIVEEVSVEENEEDDDEIPDCYK